MANNSLVVIFIIIGALALVAQTIIMIVGAVVGATAVKRGLALLEDLRGHIAPAMISAKDLLDETGPRIKKITANVEQVSDTVARQTKHLDVVMDDVLRRSQVHINQADAIVGQTLDTVEQTRASVTHVVMQPVKWLTAVANGIATGVQTLLERKRGGNSANSVTKQHRPWEPGPEDLVD
jgi:methyl-accepting chemotaxis protein